MAFCWQQRGCDEEMQSTCPHNVPTVYSPCPMDCCFTVCDKPQHDQAGAFEILEADVDFNAVQKEQCRTCRFFLRTAPKISRAAETA